MNGFFRKVIEQLCIRTKPLVIKNSAEAVQPSGALMGMAAIEASRTSVGSLRPWHIFEFDTVRLHCFKHKRWTATSFN